MSVKSKNNHNDTTLLVTITSTHLARDTGLAPLIAKIVITAQLYLVGAKRQRLHAEFAARGGVFVFARTAIERADRLKSALLPAAARSIPQTNLTEIFAAAGHVATNRRDPR